MVRLPRRGAIGLLAAWPFAALAQGAYPSRPVRVVIPFGPGGGSDNLARVIEPGAARALGQTLVIETRPGAASVIGTELVARADPDGYTALLVDATFSINPGLLPRLPYDPVRDFIPTSLLASGSTVLLAHPSLGVGTLQEFLALARARPGQLSYASGGNGSNPHLAGELLKIVAGIDILHVPYRGTGPATNDVVGGHVPIMFNGISAARPHVDAGRLRPLAVTGTQRNRALPDVPTFAEAGLQGLDASGHWGVLLPARTPDPIVRRLSDAFGQAVRDPAVGPRLEALGFTPVGGGPEEYAALLRAETVRWTQVIRTANIKPD